MSVGNQIVVQKKQSKKSKPNKDSNISELSSAKAPIWISIKDFDSRTEWFNPIVVINQILDPVDIDDFFRTLVDKLFVELQLGDGKSVLSKVMTLIIAGGRDLFKEQIRTIIKDDLFLNYPKLLEQNGYKGV